MPEIKTRLNVNKAKRRNNDGSSRIHQNVTENVYWETLR